MKKYLSAAMLVIRYSLYPVLWILGLMVLGEVGMFLFSGGLGESNLYRAVQDISAHYFFYGALVLTSIVLSRALCDKGGRMNNTILRLSLSEKQLFGIQAAYNTFVYLLLFLIQGLVFILLSLWYSSVHPEAMNQQTIFVTAYQHWMFHTFFPLDNLFVKMMMGFLAMALGICTAAYPMRQRHGKRSFSTVFMVLFALFYFYLQCEGNHLDYSALVYTLCPGIFCIVSALVGTLTMEVDENG